MEKEEKLFRTACRAESEAFIAGSPISASCLLPPHSDGDEIKVMAYLLATGGLMASPVQ